jgi:tRNA acetyltransferase TAN1
MEGRKRKDRSHYKYAAKKAKMSKYQMVPGIKGFLLFCNQYEKETIREGYRILNQFADNIYGKEEETETKEEAKDKEQEEEEDDDDVDAALEREKQQLDKVVAKKVEERRFQVVGSGIQNVLFIRTNVPSPVDLAVAVMKEVEATGTQISRYLLRLVPVESTCKAFDETVREAAKGIVGKWFAGKGAITYCIQFKARLNSSFGREDAFKEIGRAVREANPEAKVEFKKPDLVVIVEVMKSHCCLAVVPDYFTYKKYNIAEVANASMKKKDSAGIVEKNSAGGTDDKITGEDLNCDKKTNSKAEVLEEDIKKVKDVENEKVEAVKENEDMNMVGEIVENDKANAAEEDVNTEKVGENI